MFKQEKQWQKKFSPLQQCMYSEKSKGKVLIDKAQSISQQKEQTAGLSVGAEYIQGNSRCSFSV